MAGGVAMTEGDSKSVPDQLGWSGYGAVTRQSQLRGGAS